MKNLYIELLGGTFRAEIDIDKPIKELRVRNNSDIPVQPKLWTDVFIRGFSQFPVIPPWGEISISASTPWPGTYVGDVIIFSSASTGGFMSAELLTRGSSTTSLAEVSSLPAKSAAQLAPGKLPDVGADWRDLIDPNDLGSPPAPTSTRAIPIDSPRVIVGLGSRRQQDGGSWTALIHEQHWRRSSSSFTLAPGETRTITTSHTSGRTETSSEESVVSESIGANVSAGWGPISASISASLSRSDTTSRSIALSESDSVSMQMTYTNNHETASELILFWNIVDIYTWIGASRVEGNILATIESIQPPALIRTYLHSESGA